MNAFIKNNYKPLIIAIVPVIPIIGTLPAIAAPYYLMLSYFFITAANTARKVNTMPMIFLIVLAVSIIVGDPDPLFRSWSRLGLFLLLFGAIFPLFTSKTMDSIRARAAQYTLWILAGIGVLSFICYPLGINFSQNSFWETTSSIQPLGIFGGITKHSMMLGPLAAIGSIFLFYQFLFPKHTRLHKIFLMIATLLSLFAVFISASRGATIGALAGLWVIGFMRYRHNFKQILKKSILLVGALIVFSPIYRPYFSIVEAKQQRNELNGGTLSSRDDKWNNRIKEFKHDPLFGCGFAAMDINSHGDYNPQSGIVEPGSSWLFVLSTTGIVGFSILAGMFLTVLFKICRHADLQIQQYNLYIGIMSFFMIHLLIEGYIFAGGSYLCFIFWLLFGHCYSLTFGSKCTTKTERITT